MTLGRWSGENYQRDAGQGGLSAPDLTTPFAVIETLSYFPKVPEHLN
jgi:hypothetical protein